MVDLLNMDEEIDEECCAVHYVSTSFPSVFCVHLEGGVILVLANTSI